MDRVQNDFWSSKHCVYFPVVRKEERRMVSLLTLRILPGGFKRHFSFYSPLRFFLTPNMWCLSIPILNFLDIRVLKFNSL